MTDLFRKEVIEHQTRRLAGSVILGVPVPITVFVAFLGIIGFAAVLFASLSTYARKETVVGWIVPDAGLIRAVASVDGVVSSLSVAEGDVVGVGELLATLQVTPTAPESGHARPSSSILIDEERELERTILLQQERVAFAQRNVDRFRRLMEAGQISNAMLEAQRAQAIVTEQDLSALRRQLLSVRRNIAAETVRAPVAGRIAVIAPRPGEPIQAGGTIATIIPDGSTLQAELFVPTRAAGFIQVGQEVRLSYDAFPRQRFGFGHGSIVGISETVFMPAAAAQLGVQINEPVFRVEVALSEAFVEAYGKRVHLQPGMLLSADVVIDRRSMMEWLLDPLYAAGSR